MDRIALIAHGSPDAVVAYRAGIALTALYAPNGWLGRWLLRLGIQVAFTPLGIVVALTFIGLPFVVRTLQPVLEDLDKEVEQAAATLGASAAQAFARVILPALWPALLTGFALAFARAVGGPISAASVNLPSCGSVNGEDGDGVRPNLNVGNGFHSSDSDPAPSTDSAASWPAPAQPEPQAQAPGNASSSTPAGMRRIRSARPGHVADGLIRR